MTSNSNIISQHPSKRSKYENYREEEWLNITKEEKRSDVWRFVVGNINTLPSLSTGLGIWKVETWKDLVLECDVNVITEINKDTTKVKESDKLEEITKGWWKGCMCRAEYLVEDDYAFREQKQQGGVAVLANGPVITHIIAQGGDDRRLGRWRWFVVRGKNQRKTCVIGCYRPGITWVATANQAIALQKKRKIGEDVFDPITIWLEDMKNLILTKQNEGCEIILTGDFNDDLQNANSHINVLARQLGLREALIEQYALPDGFSTYSRGSTVIDGVFLSQGLHIERGGYTSFDESPSDHRWIWFDITTYMIVGGTLSERARPLERKATSKVPSIKERFNHILNEQIVIHNMVNKTKLMDEAIKRQMKEKGMTDQTLHIQIDRLNEILVRIVKTADRRCQKGRRGTIPSSPVIHQAKGAIRILRLVMRRWKEKGQLHRPKYTRLKRLAKKYNYHGQLSFQSLTDIQEACKRAYRHFQGLKPFAVSYRETYLGQIAEEISCRDGKDIDKHFRNLMHQEETRRQFRRIKLAEGRYGRHGVSMVEKESNGRRIRITDKTEMEHEIIQANKSKLLQAGNTPLRMTPLQELLGEQMEFEKWEEILKGGITLPTEGVEEGTRLWYQFISTQEIVEFTIDWTPEEYFESWKKMSEDK